MRLFKGGSRDLTRLFFATDIHGSERCFRKWLNAAKVYDARILILGGDVSGKMLVPVVADDGGWHATVLDERLTAGDEDELEELRKRIRNMGRYDVVLGPEEARRLQTDPALGDAMFRNAATRSLERWIGLAEERLADDVDAYMMLGNDDEESLADVIRNSTKVCYAEDEVWELAGGWRMLSYGPSTPTPWNTPRERNEDEIGEAIERLAEHLEDPRRTVFNVHCSPSDTHLDQAPKLDEQLRPIVKVSGPVIIGAGSKAVRAAIKQHQPALGLHGHVHESPGISRLGDTLCINPGSDYADGILRGAIVDLDQDGGVARWQLVQG
jgi:Icc-related predicted phosphoesterase